MRWHIGSLILNYQAKDLKLLIDFDSHSKLRKMHLKLSNYEHLTFEISFKVEE